MIELNDLKPKILKILLIAGIVLIVLSILYFIFSQISDFNKQRKQNQLKNDVSYPIIVEPGTDEDNPLLKYPTISTSFKVINFTENQMSYYKYDPKKSLSDGYIDKLIADLGLTKFRQINDDFLGSVVLAGNNDVGLSIYQDNGEILYTQNIYNTPSTLSNDKDIEFYEQKGEEYLEKFGFDLGTYEFTNYVYYVKESESPEIEIINNKGSANLIEVIFTAQKDNYPIIDKIGSLVPTQASVLINSSGELVRLKYQSIGNIGSKNGEIEIKDQTQLTSDIQNGQGKIIYTNFSPVDTIKSVQATEASLNYIPADSLLVPIYVVKLEITTDKNNSSTGYMYVEAIK